MAPTVEQSYFDPVLARRQPDQYKQSLIDYLTHSTAYGGVVWSRCRQWNLLRDFDVVEGQASGSRHGHIYLGVDIHDLKVGESNLFEGGRFSYEGETAFIFLHELCHRLLPMVESRSGDFWFWLRLAKDFRAKPGNIGFTINAGTAHYEKDSPFVRAREDLVELCAMGAYDPAYLSRYIGRLSESSYEAQAYRREKRLVYLSPESGQRLINAVMIGIQSIADNPILQPNDIRLYYKYNGAQVQ